MKLIDEGKTVRKFLNYLKLRWENGYPINKEEEMRTYQVYEAYCVANNLKKVNRLMFYTILNQMGIATSRQWDQSMKRMVMVRNLTKEKIIEALAVEVDTSSTKAGIVEIDGERFQIIVKLIKIGKVTTDPSVGTLK